MRTFALLPLAWIGSAKRVQSLNVASAKAELPDWNKVPWLWRSVLMVLVITRPIGGRVEWCREADLFTFLFCGLTGPFAIPRHT